MSFRIGQRVFSPRPWAVAATALLLALFVSLGYWQLGRAREKQALIESFNEGGETTVALGPDAVDGLPRYQHVSALGRFEPGRQILLDNMPSSEGRPGYRVLTPLRRTDGGSLLLVDRGWVPLGPTREQLPDVSVTADAREVSGTLDGLPEPGVRLGPAGTPGDSGWPRVLNFPTRDDVESALGEAVESRILLLDPGRPDGFERVWRPALGFGPERHLGYAIQWFALALTLVVIFIALSLRRSDGQEAGNS
jgi:surfeit locus 1 family protein